MSYDEMPNFFYFVIQLLEHPITPPSTSDSNILHERFLERKDLSRDALVLLNELDVY